MAYHILLCIFGLPAHVEVSYQPNQVLEFKKNLTQNFQYSQACHVDIIPCNSLYPLPDLCALVS
jgi:hypothetical protein